MKKLVCLLAISVALLPAPARAHHREYHGMDVEFGLTCEIWGDLEANPPEFAGTGVDGTVIASESRRDVHRIRLEVIPLARETGTTDWIKPKSWYSEERVTRFGSIVGGVSTVSWSFDDPQQSERYLDYKWVARVTWVRRGEPDVSHRSVVGMYTPTRCIETPDD